MAFVALVIRVSVLMAAHGKRCLLPLSTLVETHCLFAFVAAKNLFSHGGEWQKIRTPNHE